MCISANWRFCETISDSPNRDTDCTPPHRLLSSLIPMSRNILEGFLPDDDEIDHEETDTFKPST